MEIRFISSLTAEDENLFAPALLKAIGTLLDQLPIAYTLRLETTGAQVFQHSHAIAQDGGLADSLESPVSDSRSLVHATRLSRASNGS
jgi:hypothetical protein